MRVIRSYATVMTDRSKIADCEHVVHITHTFKSSNTLKITFTGLYNTMQLLKVYN